jgi:hypothetical protein
MIGLCVAGVTVMVVAVVCRACLRRELERVLGMWDGIYLQLVDRCKRVGELADLLRQRLKTNPRLADDIHYLLKRMEETNDPYTHAAVQNGLVLTVQTAVEQFHRSEEFSADRDLERTMQAIGAIDSGLISLRDRFNDRVRRYNRMLNTPPFSVMAWLARTPERKLFSMLIPWWSINPAAYGQMTADDIRQALQSWHAPLILAPSQRSDWPGGGGPVVRVPPRTPGAPDAAGPQQRPDGRVARGGGRSG